jgi:hypothetical protein
LSGAVSALREEVEKRIEQALKEEKKTQQTPGGTSE